MGRWAPKPATGSRCSLPHAEGAWPWATLLTNVFSFVLGAVTATATAPATAALVGVGFCGALTTYSTFGYETVALVERRAVAVAAANVAGSVVVGIAAAVLGRALGHALG